MQITQLDAVEDCAILDKTVSALAAGKLCMTKGYGFYWPPYEEPTVVTPDGREVHPYIIEYSPYLIS